jgi:hypothetical protein
MKILFLILIFNPYARVYRRNYHLKIKDPMRAKRWGLNNMKPVVYRVWLANNSSRLPCAAVKPSLKPICTIFSRSSIESNFIST